MSNRPRLDATIIATIDVGDQPKAPYVFVVEGLLGPRQAFTIDNWVIEKDYVEGRRGLHVVVACPVSAPWAIVRREDLVFTTLTESAKKRKADDLAQANFEKELYPADNGTSTPGRLITGSEAPGMYL